ncbi:tape measure protein [Anaerotruncus sp. 1XD42-93]|uniref:tape measure protein n=1 Tax=Anaerotruncus sp. 1XD42-93 TaxID=2320853 RepID=UPI000EA2ED67|nr:tape measure protein [Anaerotruncus sp. 1XD42-93]NBK18198.1 phage tail tape measure protein [Anaerotruncus sp. 1XD42-93]NCE73415.1 phage tail tape measure protein [Anaerotruncus sp. X29]RKJ92358.1 phage tail tape measure protein [Anaerotruncus sp. 1XD22-93]
MSKTIDERVVSMRFDNKQFEQNVQTSLSTLDKLKQKLNLTGAAKGLEEVNSAARKCDMNPLSNAVETVRVKFSAMEVMAITALQNITNSALAAGKNIISALTIDPVKSGFQEYETQINAVQTILANTSSKGTTLEQVNKALDELNHYADMTIYNFTEMTRNIGTFTAAGVDLDTSVAAIKGIANLAAVSGSTSQQASTAMYQLSQALAAGTVKLQDWNSVVNAGMGGQVFQDSLKETARVHGIAIDQMIEDEGSFRETLSKGWLTSDILTETLSKFTGDLNEKQLKTMGYTEEQIKSIIKMGQTANDAATKVKTFTQLFDTLKEAAQSGWTQSWEIIIGDFEKAKERLTELSDIFSGIIGRSADSRNAVLEGAFSSKWDVLVNKLNTAGIETETFQNKVKELAKSHNVDLDAMIEKEGSFEKALKKAFNDGTLNKSILKDALKSLVGDLTGATKSTEEMAGQMEKYGEIVDKVIRGDFGSGEARIKALTEAGYDYATVQNLVNEKLGSSVRHMSSLTEEQLKNADSLASLSDEQLKNKGYTEEQITALRDLQREANTAGSSIDELINDFEKPSGAELVWGSVLNVIHSVVDSLGAVKKAWNDTFHHGMTEDDIIKERSEKLYNLIKAINTFTEKLEITDDKADKITRTFKGLFAILDIVMTVTGGGLRLAFKGLSVILNAFDMDVLDLTAKVGDLISGFRDFILNNDRVTRGVKAAASGIKTACTEVKKWIDAFMALPVVQKNITRFETAFSNTFSEFGKYFRGGIDRINDFIERVKALDHITLDDLNNIFRDFKDNVIDYFLDVDGKFDDIKKAIREFKDDVKKHFASVGEDLDGLKEKIFNFAKSIKQKFSDHIGIGEILTIGLGGSLILFVKKIGDALETLAGPFDDLSGILSGFDKLLKSASKAINAFAMKTKSQALMNVAISVGILAASIVALTLVDQTKLWSAVGALGVLSAGLLGVSAAMGIIGKIGGGKGSTSMLGIAASLLILIHTLKSMEGLDQDKVWQNVAVLGVMASGLAVMAGLLGKFAPKLSKGSVALLVISGSLKIMVSAFKDLDSLQLNNLDQSIKILLGAMGGLVALAVICKNIKLGSAVTILATVVALKIFVGVFDDIANLDTTKMKTNMEAFVGIFGTFAVLMISSKFAGANAAKAGVGILAMSAALLLITATLKILGKMEAGDLRKATGAVAQLLVLFAGVVAVSKFAGANAVKAGAMLLLMSGALLILSGAMVIISHIKPDGLNQALKAIALLEILFAGLIAVSYLAKDCKSTLTLISVTIGILAVALGTLSMINPENLFAASLSLSMVMAMFGALVASTSLAKKANGTLVVLTGVVIALGGVLYLLSGLPVDSVMGVSAALSLLLLSLSASMLIISKAGNVAPGAYVTLGVMTLVVAGLAGIIGVLAYMNVGSVLEIAEGLSVLLLSLSASCLILSAVGATGPAAFIGVGALLTLITAVGGLMIGIGALAKHYPGMEEFLNKGLSLLEKVGYGLGSFFGNIIGGFVAGATSGLPEIGTNLSSFMENASPFFEGVKNLDEAAMSGVKALAETILILTAADILQGIASWITGGSSMSDFAEQLVPFGEAMRDFSIAIGDMKSEVVEQAATAGKALAEMAATLPNSGGVLGFFAGENDMKAFGEQLVPFGEAMMEFSLAVTGLNADTVTNAATAGKAMAEMASTIPNSGGVVGFFAGENDIGEFGKQLVPFGKAMKSYSDAISGIDVDAITNSATAGKSLVELANTLPNTGGVVSWFTGDNDIGEFGNSLVSFGANFAKYSDFMRTVDAGIVTATTNAATSIVELQKSLPKEGGWFSDDMTLASFGSDMASFGSYFSSYYGYISSIDTGLLSSVITQTNRLVDMANGMAGLDTSGMTSFSSALTKLGEAGITGFIDAFNNANSKVTAAASNMLTTFVNAANAKKTTLTTTFTALVQAVLTAINAKQRDFQTAGSTLMVKFIAGVKTQDNSARSTFTNIISGCLTAIKNKYSEFQSVGTQTMVKFIAGVRAKDVDARNTFINIISGCLTAIKNKYSEFQSAGEQCMVKFIAGVRSKDADAKSAFTSGLGGAISGIRDYYGQFYDAGSYLVDGFAKGISENTYKAEAKARAMAAAAARAAEEELDEHSPSKVGYRIGDFFGVAFVNAIGDYTEKAYKAGSGMAKAARTGLGNAISKVKDFIDSDIDAQPTIRPVLDLSNVEAGTNRLNAMFSRTQALSISRGMNQQETADVQNGETSPNSGSTFTFTQNNYSPKALSRVEIYRQTKNQFSAMERMVKA